MNLSSHKKKFRGFLLLRFLASSTYGDVPPRPARATYDVTSQSRSSTATHKSREKERTNSGPYHPEYFSSASKTHQLTQIPSFLSPTYSAMADSLAAFRQGRSGQLRNLAEEHLQHEYVHRMFRNRILKRAATD